jgi:hypothetical protein
VADNLKLSFDFRMDGADQVSRTMRNLAQDLNNIPKSAQEGLRMMGDNINSILKSLGTLSSAQSGLQGLDKNMEKAFGAAQVNLVRNLKREIEDLEKQIEKLGDKTNDFNKAAKKARSRGLGRAAERAEGLATETALSQYSAQELLNDSKRELDRITNPPPPPTRMQQVGNALNAPVNAGEMITGLLSKLGLGGLATIGGGIAAGAGTIAYAGANYLATGSSLSAIAQRRYEEQAAQEAIYGGDPTRTILRQRGLGPEGELLQGGYSFSNLVRGGFGLLAGVRSAVVGKGFNTGIYDYLTGLSNLGKEQFFDLQRITGFRQRVSESVGLAESVLGQEGTYGALGQLRELGVDLDAAAPAVNALVRFGVTPGRNDARLALLQERFGTSASLIEQIARREGFGGGSIALFLRGRDVNRGVTEVQQMIAAAGLGGRRSFAAREPFSELASENLGFRDFTGSESIGAVNAGLAASVRAAQGAAPGMTAVDVVGAVGQQFQAERRAQDTAFDPRRIATIGALVSQGLSYAEAEVAVRLGLDNPSVRARISGLLQKRTGRKVDVGGVLSTARRQLDTAFNRALGQPGLIGEDFNEAIGGGNAGQDILLTGARNVDVARARRAVGAAQFTGEEGTALPEQAADTTAAQQRRERAAVDATLSSALTKLGSTITEAIRGQSTGISQNVEKIVKILDRGGSSVEAPKVNTVNQPGDPARGGNR